MGAVRCLSLVRKLRFASRAGAALERELLPFGRSSLIDLLRTRQRRWEKKTSENRAVLKARLGAPGCLPTLCFYNFYCSGLLPPSHCQSLPSSPALTPSFDRWKWLEDVNGRERETIHANVCTIRAEGRNPIGMEIKRCSDQKRERRQVFFFVFTVAFACGGLRWCLPFKIRWERAPPSPRPAKRGVKKEEKRTSSIELCT